jgi:hypothetical protein
VDAPRPPRVLEASGSTAAAAWFEPAEALCLSLTGVAHDAVEQLCRPQHSPS